MNDVTFNSLEHWSSDYFQLAQIPERRKSLALRYAIYNDNNYANYRPRIDFIDHVKMENDPTYNWEAYEIEKIGDGSLILFEYTRRANLKCQIDYGSNDNIAKCSLIAGYGFDSCL